MSINRKKFGALLGIVAIGIAVASTAGAARQGTPGVTANQVTIGGTFPLSEGPETGGASLYATIAGAELAYYGWVNAHGGVNGRTIKDDVLDDQYTPSETLPKDKALVENAHVFAIVGSLGTAEGLATWNYLNNKGVPQVLLATGDSYWGTCTATGSAFRPKPYCSKPKPWTMGWQPTYPSEARMYAKYILKNDKGPKIGILYQNDPYGQNYLDAFTKSLGSHKSDIVDAEGYATTEDSTSIIGRMGTMESKGANTVVIFATPGSAIAALAGEAVLHWKPAGGTFLNNVSANRVFITGGQHSAQANGANVNGVISTSYIKAQSSMPSDTGMKFAKRVIDATKNKPLIKQFNLGDNNLVYGLAVAWTFVDALKHAGANPTRSSFMKAIRNLDETGANKNPFVYPGMGVKTSSTRTFPMEQLVFEKWAGQTNSCNPNTEDKCGDWKTFGSVVNSGS